MRTDEFPCPTYTTGEDLTATWDALQIRIDKLNLYDKADKVAAEIEAIMPTPPSSALQMS